MSQQDVKEHEGESLHKAEESEVKQTGSVESKTHSRESVTPFNEREVQKGCMLAKIYTPFKTFFEGDAKSVTALNESGWFDVLPGHHNFISMLLPCDIVVETDKHEKQVIPIRRGLMHIKNDRLIVFLDV